MRALCGAYSACVPRPIQRRQPARAAVARRSRCAFRLALTWLGSWWKRLPTPCQARSQTTSAAASCRARALASASARSALTSSSRGRTSATRQGSLPRRTSTVTSAPRATSARVTWEPRKPVAPVTRTRMSTPPAAPRSAQVAEVGIDLLVRPGLARQQGALHPGHHLHVVDLIALRPEEGCHLAPIPPVDDDDPAPRRLGVEARGVGLVEVDDLREAHEGVVTDEGEAAGEPGHPGDGLVVRGAGGHPLDHAELAIAAVTQPQRAPPQARGVRAGEPAHDHLPARPGERDALAPGPVARLPGLRPERLLREGGVEGGLG